MPKTAGDDFKQAAWLKAWDPRTNKEVWRAEQPGLFAGGTLTTAGGLVFIGQATVISPPMTRAPVLSCGTSIAVARFPRHPLPMRSAAYNTSRSSWDGAGIRQSKAP